MVERISSINLPNDICLEERDLCDLELLLNGGFRPLNRYMASKDVESVMKYGKLPDGTIWPIPIMCPIRLQSETTTVKNDTKIGEKTHSNFDFKKNIKIRSVFGNIIAEVYVDDCYCLNIHSYANLVLNTNDTNHPFYNYLLNLPPTVYVGGNVKKIHGVPRFEFSSLWISPEQTRQYIQEKNWKYVVGFQTRNPMHRSHYELTKYAENHVSETTEEKTGLLISPTCGPSQPGDVDFEVRVRCYKKIMTKYEEDQVEAKLILIPIAMRMAGPREAIWHAIIRRNYGCTHFIVGRDHAGPSAKKQDGSSFYGPYDAHKALEQVASQIGIYPIFGKNFYYLDHPYNKYVQESDPIFKKLSLKFIPYRKDREGDDSKENDEKDKNQIAVKSISGTEFRRLLMSNEEIPEWFTFPSVVEVLRRVYPPRNKSGFCMYLTGLPCSGKSTLACAIKAALIEQEEERLITLLDADVVRTHLSAKLGFDKESRSLNVRRIGYVASIIAKNGGICIVANIAPYMADRTYNRKLMGQNYIEVYISTPIEVCEQRDIKELYKRARQGIIKQFTGISDPYETPIDPEISIDCSTDLIGKTEYVIDYLKKQEWIS